MAVTPMMWVFFMSSVQVFTLAITLIGLAAVSVFRRPASFAIYLTECSGKAYASVLISIIAESSHHTSAFGEAFGQQHKILDFITTRKPAASGSNFTKSQRCSFGNFYLKADIFHKLYRPTNSAT